jgi:hypothetical protein
MIESIARRWFETDPATQNPRWEDQPESVREHYIALARQFWAQPGKLTRELQSIAISTRQITSNVDRATKAWVE